jgi:hypothetical protein
MITVHMAFEGCSGDINTKTPRHRADQSVVNAVTFNREECTADVEIVDIAMVFRVMVRQLPSKTKFLLAEVAVWHFSGQRKSRC